MSENFRRISKDGFRRGRGRAVILVEHNPRRDGEGRAAALYATNDDADCWGAGLGVKGQSLQGPETPFERGEKLR